MIQKQASFGRERNQDGDPFPVSHSSIRGGTRQSPSYTDNGVGIKSLMVLVVSDLDDWRVG